MSLEMVALYLLSAGAGWVARHYGLFVPAQSSPQTPSQGGGTSPSPGVAADLPSMIGSIVSEEVRKGVAYLESRLPPVSPVASQPQTAAATK